MKILFDLLSQQDGFINGGSLYGLRLFDELLNSGADIIGLCDKTKEFNEEAKKLVSKYQIDLVDITEDIANACTEKQIDLVIITIEQRFHNVDLTKIKSKMIVVCHDLNDVVLKNGSVEHNNMYRNQAARALYPKKKFMLLRKIRRAVIKAVREFKPNIIEKYVQDQDHESLLSFLGYRQFDTLLKKDNVYCITVSDFSKHVIEYYFDDIKNPIKVFHAHSKFMEKGEPSKEMLDFIEKNPHFFLMISVDRWYKNALVFLQQADKLTQKLNGKYKYVFIGDIETHNENAVMFKNLSAADLELLYKNAEIFIYPSFGEGYGMPPVEAMRYGVPVIASYCTSMPEVLGDAPEYVFPFYQEEMHAAILKILSDLDAYKLRSKKQYEMIKNDQESSLKRLLNFIHDLI